MLKKGFSNNTSKVPCFQDMSVTQIHKICIHNSEPRIKEIDSEGKGVGQKDCSVTTSCFNFSLSSIPQFYSMPVPYSPICRRARCHPEEDLHKVGQQALEEGEIVK